DPVGPLLQRGPALVQILSAVVDAGHPCPRPTNMIDNRLDNMRLDTKALVHVRDHRAPQIVQRPMWNADLLRILARFLGHLAQRDKHVSVRRFLWLGEAGNWRFAGSGEDVRADTITLADNALNLRHDWHEMRQPVFGPICW